MPAPAAVLLLAMAIVLGLVATGLFLVARALRHVHLTLSEVIADLRVVADRTAPLDRALFEIGRDLEAARDDLRGVPERR